MMWSLSVHSLFLFLSSPDLPNSAIERKGGDGMAVIVCIAFALILYLCFVLIKPEKF
ncbi:potassium-transporting ATPase subunit F [Aneurinibacillus migulanus]|uniref:potassium-transporting ATPase subunit F n=1 Tax=Aneurinibacillus migulanus TaxID=47500 RepID=UPI003B97AB50